jgi:hypothetical protein
MNITIKFKNTDHTYIEGISSIQEDSESEYIFLSKQDDKQLPPLKTIEIDRIIVENFYTTINDMTSINNACAEDL